MYLLETKKLKKAYKGRTVVDGVNININRGEIVGLLGPNGAGKTTTFYMVVGVIKPNDGQIYFRGENITTLPMYKRARLGIGEIEESRLRDHEVVRFHAGCHGGDGFVHGVDANDLLFLAFTLALNSGEERAVGAEVHAADPWTVV